MPKTVFLAGATGFTARAVLAEKTDIAWILPIREGSRRLADFSGDDRVRVVRYDDPASIADAMAGCDAVLSTIGTTRAQFKEGVSYETVDYGTTVALIEAAKTVGAAHFVLMSSIGAGHPVGPYLKWKALAEKAVIASGLSYAIARPSFLMGEGRSVPGIVNDLIDGLGKVPGLGGMMADLRGIPIEVVAWNFVRLLETGPGENRILAGRDLWAAWNARAR